MEKLTIRSVERENLTESDFIGIHEVMQDMWASEDGLGELAQCHDCGKMLSKESVFSHLSKELMQEKVADIMRILWTDSVSCTVCGGETRLIYGPGNVEKIKDRILNSVDSFLVLCTSEEKGIVGFEEAYIDSLERVFQLDLTDHYKNIGLSEISRRVDTILGYTPDEILLLSSIGLLKPYRNFQNLFDIMSQFAHSLPEAHFGIPWLTELNRGGVTHKMNDGISEGISLGIQNDPNLRPMMRDMWEKFDSDLIVYDNPVKIYKERFTNGMKYFLKSLRKPKWQILQHRSQEAEKSITD